MLHCDKSHPIVTRGFRVSHAPPHHTLPAFLNLIGTLFEIAPGHLLDWFHQDPENCKLQNRCIPTLKYRQFLQKSQSIESELIKIDITDYTCSLTLVHYCN